MGTRLKFWIWTLTQTTWHLGPVSRCWIFRLAKFNVQVRVILNRTSCLAKQEISLPTQAPEITELYVNDNMQWNSVSVYLCLAHHHNSACLGKRWIWLSWGKRWPGPPWPPWATWSCCGGHAPWGWNCGAPDPRTQRATWPSRVFWPSRTSWSRRRASELRSFYLCNLPVEGRLQHSETKLRFMFKPWF